MAGLKDACGNMAQTLETMRRTRKNCELYSGEDALNLPILLSGGAGVISVVSNLAPKAVKAMYLAITRGDISQAIKINDILAPLTSACFCEVNPIPVKAALNALGYFCGIPRAPLTPLEKAHESLMKSAIEQVKIAAIQENICGGNVFLRCDCVRAEKRVVVLVRLNVIARICGNGRIRRAGGGKHSRKVA